MLPTLRILIATAIALTTLHAAEVHAVSQRKLCRLACGDEIEACIEWGESKRRCKRRIVRECRREGLARCGAEPAAVRAGKGWSLYTPESPAATALSSTVIEVTWLDTNTQETSYEIERSTSAGGPFILIGSTGPDGTVYRDGGLPAGATRYYRVRAARERSRRTVYSWYSVAVGATTFPSGAVPTTSSTSTSTSSSSSSSTLATTTTIVVSTTTTTVAPNVNPVAIAGPDRIGTAGSPIVLDGRASYDPDGWLTGHIWIFGDGAPAEADAVISHTFAQPGTYDVTLWVRDNRWAWDSDVVRVTVNPATSSTTTSSSTSSSTTSSSTSTSSSSVPSTAPSSTSTSSSSTSTSSSTTLPNRPPVANAGADVFTQSLTSVTFNGAGSSDPDGSIVSWRWTFSDGATKSGAIVSHAFQTPGPHSATLRVTDDDGAVDTDVAVVSVSNRPPVAMAGADRSSLPGSAVAFDGSASYDLDGEITSWVWNFGDGTSSAGMTASHAYQQAGTYTVTLGVADDAGGLGFDTATVTVTAPAGGDEWAARLGGSGSDFVNAVAVDAAGNVAVAGFFMNTMVVDGTTLASAGNTDGFVAKFSPTGKVLWLNAFGGADADMAETVAFDGAGNVVVAGSFSRSVSFGGPSLTSRGGGDIFVAKYSPSGAHLWSRSYGDVYNDTAYGVTVDGAGNPILTGYFAGTVNFGAATCRVPFTSDLDVYLLKLSASGTPSWVKCFWNTAAEVGYAVATDTAGSVYLTGSFNGRIDLGGGVFDAAGVLEDVFVAKFSAAGAHMWSRLAGDDSNDRGRGLATDGAGNVYVVGSFKGAASFGGTTLQSNGGSSDVFVAKYGSAGNHLWSRRYGGAEDDEAIGVTVDGAGEPVVTGFFRDTMDAGGGPLVSHGLRDVFLLRLSTGGAHRASASWGGSQDDRGLGVAATPSGHVAVGGTFKTTMSVVGTTLSSAGGPDACVVQQDL